MNRLEVRPLFFVPSDAPPPTDEQTILLGDHVAIARDRYRDLLKDRDTFSVSAGAPAAYRSGKPLAHFEDSADQGASKYVVELLRHFATDRVRLPYILLIVVVNPHRDFPPGGGRPLNGGHDGGGGIAIMSSFLLNLPEGKFQSTLQHELGHAFGLVHVDRYGYDMNACPSIMSYNPRHHWKGLHPPAEPGILIPEDVRALAKNKPAFPDLWFDPQADVPPGYEMAETASLPPMEIGAVPRGE